MKKICLITAGLLPVPSVKGGAIETIINNIIDQNEIEKSLDLTVVTIYNKDAYELSKKYKYTKFKFINKRKISYILGYLINKIKSKITNFQTSTFVNKVLTKIKHEKYDYIFVEGSHYESYKKYLKFFDRSQMVLHLHHHLLANDILNETFGTVITVSDFIGKEWAKKSKNQTIITLKNGIDITKFAKKIKKYEEIKLKKKYNIQPNDFIIAYCGRLVEIKGVLELVKSIKTIDDPNLKLLLIGASNFSDNTKTEYGKKIEDEVENIKSRVIFTGYINNDELYKYYKLANVVVIPTIVEDAAPLTTVEALACGKPLIVTRSGGIPEFVTKKNAIIVEKDETLIDNLSKSILELMKNEKKIKKMSEDALENSKNYNLPNYYKNLLKIISKLK